MARTLLRYAGFLILAASSAAQREGPPAGTAAGVVAGRVVAADTGAPVPDAMVVLGPADVMPEQIVRVFGPTRDSGVVSPTQEDSARRAAAMQVTRSAAVDANGHFTLSGVVAGRYRLSVAPGVTAARYLPAQFPDPAGDDPTPLTVGPGQLVDNLVVSLPRAAAISGRMVDERGRPMALVSVLAQEVLPGDRRRPAPGIAANVPVRSDDNGAFRLFGLRPGTYILVAQPSRTTAMSVALAVVTATAPAAPTYFPGTAALAEATRIRLGAGVEYGPVEFTVTPTWPHTVRGVLLDPGGQPVGHVNVTLRPQAEPVVGTHHGSTTKPDGTFELRGVAPGDYAFLVNRFAIDVGSQFAWMPLTVQDDIDGLTLRLQPAVSVSGHVQFEGPEPSPLPSMYVRSISSRSQGANASSVAVGADRSFTLENQFGPVLVRTDGPAGWYLKTVLYGGRDVTDQPTAFVAGGGSLQVVLTQGGATLSGTVSTPASVPAEAEVVVFAEDPALWLDRASQTRITLTTATGRYRIDGLRPGRYLAAAVMYEDGALAGMSPGLFELLAARATPVVLGDGESKTLDLKRVRLR